MSEQHPAGPAGWDSELGPIRVIFGAGVLDRIGDEARRIDAHRVLVVTDPGVRGAGHLARAVDSLERESVSAVVFDDVGENPGTRHVEAAADLARRERIDAFVALGGGSAMDCARGANFLVTGGGTMEDYRGAGKAVQPMLPSLGIPTTTGTGSESQSYALITQEGSGAKMACGDKKAMFRTVLLDPRLPATARS